MSVSRRGPEVGREVRKVVSIEPKKHNKRWGYNLMEKNRDPVGDRNPLRGGL